MKKEVNPSVGKLMQMTRTPEEAKEFPDEVEFVRKGQVCRDRLAEYTFAP